MNRLKPVEIEKKSSRKPLLVVYGVFAFLLVISTIVLTIASTIKGSEISYLEKQKQQLKLENEELISKTVSSSSLTQISAASGELGLVKPQTIIYLNHEASVASLR
ncbi:MAG: hypothetical protein AAB546_03945 [Patescibacteria group bacterium]